MIAMAKAQAAKRTSLRGGVSTTQITRRRYTSAALCRSLAAEFGGVLEHYGLASAKDDAFQLERRAFGQVVCQPTARHG
jgi:hypothetical protein